MGIAIDSASGADGSPDVEVRLSAQPDTKWRAAFERIVGDACRGHGMTVGTAAMNATYGIKGDRIMVRMQPGNEGAAAYDEHIAAFLAAAVEKTNAEA